MNLDELAAHLDELRRARAGAEIVRLARRFVERGKGTDTIRLFTPAEIRLALDQIEQSERSLQFVDPIRIRMYRRYLQQVEAQREGGQERLRKPEAAGRP